MNTPKRPPGPLEDWLLRRRYAKLKPEQKNLLRSVYQRGTRRFEMQDIKARWFEELEEAGFVEYVYSPILVAGVPASY